MGERCLYRVNHMEFPSKELLNYGVAVFILVPVLGFFLWAGRAIVRSLLEHAKIVFEGLTKQQTEFSEYMRELTHTLAGIRENCQACRADAVSSARDSGDRLERVTWAAYNQMVTKFGESLTGAAQSIRESNARLVQDIETRRLLRENAELSRDHDVGGGVR